MAKRKKRTSIERKVAEGTAWSALGAGALVGAARLVRTRRPGRVTLTRNGFLTVKRGRLVPETAARALGRRALLAGALGASAYGAYRGIQGFQQLQRQRSKPNAASIRRATLLYGLAGRRAEQQRLVKYRAAARRRAAGGAASAG